MSIMQKKILTVIMVGLLSSSPAIADFQVIESTPTTPLRQDHILTESDENTRLRAELDRLSVELAQVKADLEFARTDAAQSRQALLIANEKLDLIQSKTVVSFAFNSTKFTPQPETAQKLVASAKRAGTVNIRGYTDSSGHPAANHRVALQRASAAKQYLVNQGVEEMKINVFGSAGAYVASNATQVGRLANRRVEIDFLP